MSLLSKQMSTLPKTESQLIEIKRLFDINSDMYTYLLQKRAEAYITQASTVSSVKAIDYRNNFV